MNEVSYYEDELSEIEEEETENTTNQEKTEKRLDIEKPYLRISDLKKGNLEKEIPILEWLEYLLSKKEMDGLIEVLSYYIDLGWLSKKSRNYLISYARGFDKSGKKSVFSEIQMSDEGYKLSKEGQGEVEETEKRKNNSLTPKDHIKSLYYIVQIIKEKISEEEYKRITEKVEKRLGIEKSVEKKESSDKKEEKKKDEKNEKDSE